MMFIISLLMLIFGLVDNNLTLILSSGLFGIASSIDSFTHKYFEDKTKDEM